MSLLPENATLTGIRREGQRADALLAKAGITLTQGGEPTFLPEDTSAAEWNLEAMGPEKLSHSWSLCGELAKSLMPGAFILKSNGKHYPGEPIPRWKLTLLRRSAGLTLWKDTSLLLQGRAAASSSITPRKFLSVLSSELDLPTNLHPAYEDVEAAMRHAAAFGNQAPIPRYSRKKKGFVQPRWSATDRERWSALHKASGWVLPLGHEKGRWITGHWSFPDGELRLLPGNSAIGLRLPLSQLPQDSLRTAITAEIRDGALLLFLPPLPDAESFAELLAAVERTASALSSAPIAIEGYPPPETEGWESLSVIPDPGVIEVNLPPAASWGDLESYVTALYAAAERAGLRASRTLTSGEKVPTGGGGHLVLGGKSLESNPFLLKPWLLPSFLRFIQHHPSLSYLFSGRFTGPSSQAPRVDESFFEIPYELEVALRGIESMESPADPAMIDAILRNLLLDFHGNTHKAEVSVDKFFNPFMPNGRLGLVEFRSIEMSPDHETFLGIHALWRALAAVFASEPYREPLAEWGSELHDRFLLPAFLEEDFRAVLTFLSGHGFSFDPAWFGTHFGFRFPLLAKEEVSGMRLLLRRALEPWPLLGEQPTPSGGLVRCVDSSTERLELHVTGGDDSVGLRINGHPLPLRTHPSGGWVGGVRFRTIFLPTCLHPHASPDLPMEIVLHRKEAVLGAWSYSPWPVRDGDDRARKYLLPLDAEKPQASPKKPPQIHRTARKTLDLRALSAV
jgi:uncharacterized protein (DUF2126 family)